MKQKIVFIRVKKGRTTISLGNGTLLKVTTGPLHYRRALVYCFLKGYVYYTLKS